MPSLLGLQASLQPTNPLQVGPVGAGAGRFPAMIPGSVPFSQTDLAAGRFPVITPGSVPFTQTGQAAAACFMARCGSDTTGSSSISAGMSDPPSPR